MSQPTATACRVHSRQVMAHEELLRQVVDALSTKPRIGIEAQVGTVLAVLKTTLEETIPDADDDPARPLRVAASILAEATERWDS